MKIENIDRERLDRTLFEALRAIYKFEITKENKFGLSYQDIFLLQYLRSHSPARMGSLAEELNIPISTATRVVDRLQQKGFLGRKKDPEDKRNIFVNLKKKGEKIVKEVEEHTYSILIENTRAFSSKELDAFWETAKALPFILTTGGDL